MITLWDTLGDLYGYSFVSQYGPSTVARMGRDGTHAEHLTPAVVNWQRALRGISPAELSRGLQECMMRAEEFPPNAAKFRDRCRPHREPYERVEFQGNALPQMKADKAVAQSHIDGLRNRIVTETESRYDEYEISGEVLK
jgi:hypothetical protein